MRSPELILYILEEGHAPEDGPTALLIIKLNSDAKSKTFLAMGHIGGKTVKYIAKMSKTRIELPSTRYTFKYHKFLN
jgi:hypothetical protein